MPVVRGLPGFLRAIARFIGIQTDTIEETTANAGVTIDGVLLKDNAVTVGSGGKVTTDTIDEKTAGAGVTVDGCLIKDGAVAKVATTSTFQSAVAGTAGTGSPAATAHGLGVTPGIFFAYMVGTDGNAGAITAVTADATNVTVTAPAGVTYRIFAQK